jgi:hypothetical protein
VTHSRNLAARSELSIVVFGSQTAISTGQAVYMSAVAGQGHRRRAGAGIAIFSYRAMAHGGREWTVADVSEPAPLRLYRATVSAQFMLDKSGEGPLVRPPHAGAAHGRRLSRMSACSRGPRPAGSRAERAVERGDAVGHAAQPC